VSNLQTTLAQVKDRGSKHRGHAINEQDTKATLIEPLLRALGWDLEDLEEVKREFKPKSMDNPVDYALLLVRTPCLFIEAKALGENLNDRKWASQIMGYAAVAGVEWVVLTNGDEYRLYNAHAPVPVEEKIFRTVRISDDDQRAEETLGPLSKERMQENQLNALWQTHFVDRQLRPAIEGLFAPVPDPALIALLRKRITNLSPAAIKAGLNRIRFRFDFPPEPPLSAELPRLPSSHQPSVLSQPPARRPTEWETRLPTSGGVKPLHLIRAGLIKPPFRLEARYKSQLLTASIESNGTVTFNGVTYDSLSVAAGYARSSVKGPPSDGSKFWSTNGWVFWQFRDAAGHLNKVDALRQRYLRRVVHIRAGSVSRG